MRGLEEPCASFPDFCNNRQFHVIYSTVFPLVYVLYFEEFLIHDSCLIYVDSWVCVCVSFIIVDLQLAIYRDAPGYHTKHERTTQRNL